MKKINKAKFKNNLLFSSLILLLFLIGVSFIIYTILAFTKKDNKKENPRYENLIQKITNMPNISPVRD